MSDGPARRPPALAVIVAAHDAGATVGACLAAIMAQRLPGDEVLVVTASRDQTAEVVQRAFPALPLIVAPPGSLIPQLWQWGITRSSAAFVVLTTAHGVPCPGWLAALRTALDQADVAAAGGPIVPAPPLRPLDWAIYFQRYSTFLIPRPAGPVDDLAGDNAAYRRAALAGTEALTATGFWEPFVHAEFARRELRLVYRPEAAVSYQRSYGAFAFGAQRYRHGRYFGALRAAGHTWAWRLPRAVAGPLIPLLWLWRIAGRLRQTPHYRGDFARALPFLLLFLVCWAAGEVTGYLLGAPGVRRATPGAG